MARIDIELEQLAQRLFDKPYHVSKPVPNNLQGFRFIVPDKYANQNGNLDSSYYTTDGHGTQVWLPVYLSGLPESVGTNGELMLPYVVVKISGSNEIIRTAQAEQIGKVKELWNIDDYKISIKGFFIDKQMRVFPEKDLKALKTMYELGRSFTISNVKLNIFLENRSLPVQEQNRVVMTAFDLPEVEGGRRHVVPFTMSLESDHVFNLEVD